MDASKLLTEKRIFLNFPKVISPPLSPFLYRFLILFPKGEYIAPEKIETEIQKVNWVGQVYVHGNSLQSFLVRFSLFFSFFFFFLLLVFFFFFFFFFFRLPLLSQMKKS